MLYLKLLMLHHNADCIIPGTLPKLGKMRATFAEAGAWVRGARRSAGLQTT